MDLRWLLGVEKSASLTKEFRKSREFIGSGGDGLVPFLIDWGGTAHPATSYAKGCRLMAIRAEHPDPEPVRALLAAIGSDLQVTQAPQPGLIATLDTPRGRVELR